MAYYTEEMMEAPAKDSQPASFNDMAIHNMDQLAASIKELLNENQRLRKHLAATGAERDSQADHLSVRAAELNNLIRSHLDEDTPRPRRG